MAGLMSCILLGLMMALGHVQATTLEENTSEKNGRSMLDKDVQDLKKEVMELNRDLFLLEEELLFPSSTQLSVFVSVDVGTLFGLDSIQIKIDDKVVSNYLYTQHERDALKRGGVHRIYTGNLKDGEHELVALIVGTGPKGRDYKRGTQLKFGKKLGPKFIELKILDDKQSQQPDFLFKQW